MQLIVDYLVAFTHHRFQAFPIDDLDMAARVMDQTYILQVPRRYGNALPSSAHHICDVLLRHQDLGAIHSIVAHEQPSAETLFQRMQAVADSRL
jgi:hypothetical protein